MEENKQHIEALQDIRQMMKQSSRFLSLSGFSGVFAGLYALAGAYAGYKVLGGRSLVQSGNYQFTDDYTATVWKCILICAVVLSLSILTGVIFSARRAKKTGQKLFDHTTWRLLLNLMIPLATGGIFCLAMLWHADARVVLVGPGMLLFYGLALVNGSKYTLNDVRYLGYLEIALGLLACFLPGFGLLFWALGFGVLHIVYGLYMWNRYERQ